MKITQVYKTEDGQEFTSMYEAEAHIAGLKVIQNEVVETLSKLIVKLQAFGDPVVLRDQDDSYWALLSKDIKLENKNEFDYHSRKTLSQEELLKLAKPYAIARIQALKGVLELLVKDGKFNDYQAEQLLTDYYNSNCY